MAHGFRLVGRDPWNNERERPVSEQQHHEQTQQRFRDLYDSAHAPGALDAKTKELIHIAVALAQHCEP